MLQYAKKMKQHAKTIFLPSGCCERYIDFSHYPEGAAWFGHGIALAGIGRHVPGYLIDYPKPRRQIVIVVTRGTYSVDTLDKVVTLSAGELFIIPAGIRQRYWTDDDSTCLFFLLASFSEDWPQSTGIHIRQVQHIQELKDLLDFAYRVANSNLGRSPQIARAVAELIVELLKQELDYPILSVSPEEQIPVLFRRHPERAWTIAELAAQCGLSESYLALRCRKRFGKAPGALLTEIRMTLARRLLRESDYQVKVIAATCGYPHPDSFCRAFKKEFGQTPLDFRTRSQDA